MMIHLVVKIGCACSLAHKIFSSRQRGISVTALYICVTVPLYAQILQFPTKVLHSSEPLILCERKSLLNASRGKKQLVPGSCKPPWAIQLAEVVRARACVCNARRDAELREPQEDAAKRTSGSAISKIKPKTLTLPCHPDKTRSLRRLTQIRHKYDTNPSSRQRNAFHNVWEWSDSSRKSHSNSDWAVKERISSLYSQMKAWASVSSLG